MKLVNDGWIRLVGIVIVATLRFGLMSGEIWRGTVPLILVFDNTLIAAVLIWESSRAVVLYMHRRYPLSALSGWRFGQEALMLLLVMGGVYGLRAVIFEQFFSRESTPLFFHIFGLFYTYLYGALTAAFYELLIYMEAWQKANQEAEQLKKANLMSQLDSLKNQVKPHFLFNSLNTLTALVEKDQTQAVKFIAELSKVYRYLLQSNEKELIALTGELQFTQAYFFLLQTRFGQGIKLATTIGEEYENHLIPPLTLQILLENAVKHNQVSISKPLSVRIEVEDGQWLTVSNNRQQKRVSVPTTGTGLANIAAKYKLLNQPNVIVLEEPTYFTVKVPLIPSTAL
ncbi:histidine kinase [Spirosoma taeanense]|uniref:Histidine kinase n=1 Tax=Spirosoma taeanense TaxID=2735870 RepID=A0A6M5Y883_9BACT|nr:histidine kinase [Spirosoma taeanense]QJW90538.1 histidine kinase [Spirosoma taeanense]